ncbi:glycosyltransferase [Rhodoplanes azumiensis]|uniref:Glycosyltransferase n=1 Tax=Rhodoplanes azumiensis TaxID=1897628 RepID=A0ABW5AIN5_9BRAD
MAAALAVTATASPAATAGAAAATTERSPPRLVYLVTEDWYFLMHRLPMARAAKAAGYDVHVITRINREQDRTAIEAEGFVVHPADLARGSRRPDRLLAAVRRVRALYRDIRPDIVHHVALQGAVVGALAGTGLRLPTVNGLTGLGTLFTSDAGVVSRLVRVALPALLDRARSLTTVENPDDAALLAAAGVSPARIVPFPGSGVDTDRLTPLPEPDGAPTFAYVGRMLVDKGVHTLMSAWRMLHEAGQAPRLLLAGTPDPSNSTSLSEAELRAFAQLPGVTWLGHVSDIRAVWAAAHVAVLPSRREGLPVSLLEAAACGRPLLATDVPGCREVACAGINALLVPADDPAALAAAVRRLAADPDLRRTLAAQSRSLVEAQFSAAIVGREIVALYDRVAALKQPRP